MYFREAAPANAAPAALATTDVLALALAAAAILWIGLFPGSLLDIVRFTS
jgi:hypothetical protein